MSGTGTPLPVRPRQTQRFVTRSTVRDRLRRRPSTPVSGKSAKQAFSRGLYLARQPRCGSANLPRRLREFATTTLTLTVLLAAHPAYGHTTRLERVARQVFGPRAAAALCIAHYESTDGTRLYNGVNLGPWQVSVAAHPWVDRRRVVSDWLYSARVAYRISGGGRDWSAWATHRLCGL